MAFNCEAPFTQYNVLSNRLSNRFDNRVKCLYTRYNRLSNPLSNRFSNRFDKWLYYMTMTLKCQIDTINRVRVGVRVSINSIGTVSVKGLPTTWD